MKQDDEDRIVDPFRIRAIVKEMLKDKAPKSAHATPPASYRVFDAMKAVTQQEYRRAPHREADGPEASATSCYAEKLVRPTGVKTASPRA
jgi:hypothetical protein